MSLPTHGTVRPSFLELHRRPGRPLLLPNPWDAGSARILAALGYEALATTSSGFAAALGRRDMSVTREQVLTHVAAIVAATELPVSADLENGFADDAAGVARTIELAAATGLAGVSVEDYAGPGRDVIYPVDEAVERVTAAIEAADGLVVTARAENHLHGVDDLADTIARLQRYQDAGAHVLYAPGITDAADLRSVLAEIDRPLNVLALPGTPPVAQLADLGVARVSVGGAFALAAYAGLVAAGRELREHGTYGYWDSVAEGRPVVNDALR